MAFTDYAPVDEQVEETIETNEEEVVEEVTEVEGQEPTIEEPTEEPKVEEYDINGSKVTIDELRTGYLRQQDYLSRQAELEAARKENESALELVNYLKANPHIAQKLIEEQGEVKPVQNIVKGNDETSKRLDEIERRYFVDSLNSNITNLKNKYNDFNEVDVLKKAQELGTTNLEFVYHGMRGANLDNIIAQKVNEKLAQATTDMQKNTQKTRTVIGGVSTPVDTTNGLTQQELRVAEMMGMTAEEYAKYK